MQHTSQVSQNIVSSKVTLKQASEGGNGREEVVLLRIDCCLPFCGRDCGLNIAFRFLQVSCDLPCPAPPPTHITSLYASLSHVLSPSDASASLCLVSAFRCPAYTLGPPATHTLANGRMANVTVSAWSSVDAGFTGENGLRDSRVATVTVKRSTPRPDIRVHGPAASTMATAPRPTSTAVD
jgi:hypothetical protein